MENAVLKFVLNKLDKPSENGIDDIKLLFSANKGIELAELTKVASGGEMSRIMLAIKTVFQDKNPVATLIFDEIDTGISGETAAFFNLGYAQEGWTSLYDKLSSK